MVSALDALMDNDEFVFLSLLFKEARAAYKRVKQTRRQGEFIDCVCLFSIIARALPRDTKCEVSYCNAFAGLLERHGPVSVSLDEMKDVLLVVASVVDSIRHSQYPYCQTHCIMRLLPRLTGPDEAQYRQLVKTVNEALACVFRPLLKQVLESHTTIQPKVFLKHYSLLGHTDALERACAIMRVPENKRYFAQCADAMDDILSGAMEEIVSLHDLLCFCDSLLVQSVCLLNVTEAPRNNVVGIAVGRALDILHNLSLKDRVRAFCRLQESCGYGTVAGQVCGIVLKIVAR